MAKRELLVGSGRCCAGLHLYALSMLWPLPETPSPLCPENIFIWPMSPSRLSWCTHSSLKPSSQCLVSLCPFLSHSMMMNSCLRISSMYQASVNVCCLRGWLMVGELSDLPGILSWPWPIFSHQLWPQCGCLLHIWMLSLWVKAKWIWAPYFLVSICGRQNNGSSKNVLIPGICK